MIPAVEELREQMIKAFKRIKALEDRLPSAANKQAYEEPEKKPTTKVTAKKKR